MKRKSFSVMMMLVLTIALLTACDKGGNHNFSEEWSSNETHHWHACADKGCKETKDKAEHSWSGGNVTAVLPRGLPAASTTYHLRSMLALFAMKVDMVIFLQFI